MTAITYAENAELVELAFAIADEAARSDIECLCQAINGAGINTGMFNTRVLVGDGFDLKRNRNLVDNALRYLSLRGDRTARFRFVRRVNLPHVVAFESRA